MRTTINLDHDILQVTRAMARAERRSLGAVVSSLVRRGLAPVAPGIDADGPFPTFRVEPDTGAITDEMVRAALEET
ncbi:MAG: antitoxin [Candidatus Dormibacteria bacterium]